MAKRKTPSAGAKPDKIMRTALSLELHREMDVPPEHAHKLGNIKTIQKMRLIAMATVDAAIKGEGWAVKEINNRMDGRVPMEIRGGGENGSFDFNVTNLQNMSDDVLNALIDRIALALASRGNAQRTTR